MKNAHLTEIVSIYVLVADIGNIQICIKLLSQRIKHT